MFEQQQRLSLTVAGLLLQIGLGVLPAVMPNNGSRRERNPLARLLQAPTDIDVIAGLAKLRIKTIDTFERLAPKRHVATGYVLGLLIAFENVRGLSGTGSYAGCQMAIFRRGIWAAYRDCIGALNLMDEMRKPITI